MALDEIALDGVGSYDERRLIEGDPQRIPICAARHHICERIRVRHDAYTAADPLFEEPCLPIVFHPARCSRHADRVPIHVRIQENRPSPPTNRRM